MSVIAEFKEFVSRGNVLDLAIGIVIGAAFGNIVSSLVADIIMPPLGLVISNINFKDLKYVLQTATETNPAVTINYGNFIQKVVDFIIIAFAIFITIKAINKLKRRQETKSSASLPPTREELLLSEIRDILQSKR